MEYLSLKINGMLAKNYSSSNPHYPSSQAEKLLRMGLSSNVDANFINENPLFAIYLNKDASKGELTFFVA